MSNFYTTMVSTLLHRCTTIVTEQCLIGTHKTIQILKIEGASNNMARDCIFPLMNGIIMLFIFSLLENKGLAN